MVSRGLVGARWVALLALGACTTGDAPPDHIDVVPSVTAGELGVAIEAVAITGEDRGDDLCQLATELPIDDVCSLICEPEQFAAALVATGMHRGSCYQFRCTLSESTTVSVGVCLP